MAARDAELVRLLPDAQRTAPAPHRWGAGAGSIRIPAMTDFRARGTIMGPTGLTAVFGMGTGVTPPVWSPEIPPDGGQAGRGHFAFDDAMIGHGSQSTSPVR